VLALTGPAGSEVHLLTVLLASLSPAAVLAGIARRARSEAIESSAAREVIAGTLLDHTARGERARIVRSCTTSSLTTYPWSSSRQKQRG